MPNLKPCHLTQPDAVRAIVDPTVRRFLEPFIGRESTIKSAAEQLKVSPNSVLYRVNRLLGLNLLRVTRIEARRGRSIKHYRSVADAFLATFEDFEDASIMELYARHESANLETFSSALFRFGCGIGLKPPEIVFSLFRTDLGDIKAEIDIARDGAPIDLSHPEMPAAAGSWSLLRLDHRDAKNLQHELKELLDRYEAKRGTTQYMLRLGLTPTGT